MRSEGDRGTRDLNYFVEIMEVIDLTMLGRRYTRSNSEEGEKWSRLDWFLLHPEWNEKFKLKQWGLPRALYDHCPVLLLKAHERNWGMWGG